MCALKLVYLFNHFQSSVFAIRSAKSKMAQIKEVIRKKLEVGCVQID